MGDGDDDDTDDDDTDDDSDDDHDDDDDAGAILPLFTALSGLSGQFPSDSYGHEQPIRPGPAPARPGPALQACH